MTTEFSHISVLLQEAVDGLDIKPDGTYIDCTFGRGGHSGLILNTLGDNGRLIAVDRDPSAIESAQQFADDPRFTIVHNGFSNLADIAIDLDVTDKVDGDIS